MSSYSRHDKVFLRDRPMGKPLRVWGIVVGCLSGDRYNVLVKSGSLEGRIVVFKYWDLYKQEGG
mgnify:CR=1 FL=1